MTNVRRCPTLALSDVRMMCERQRPGGTRGCVPVVSSRAVAIALVVVFGASAGAFGQSPVRVADARSLIAAGRYDDAVVAATSELDGAEILHGSNSLEVARACDLAAEAGWRNGQAGDPDVLNFARRSLAIKERSLGSHNPELASTLVQMARVLEFTGQIEKAHRALERAVEIHHSANRINGQPGIRAALELGRMLRVKGRYGASQRVLEDAIERAENRFGRTAPITIDGLREMGLLCLDSSRYREGLRLLEEVVEAKERTLPADHPDLAAALHDLGWACRLLDKLDSAQAYLERAFEIRDRSLRADHPLIAQSLENLGLLYWYAGGGPPMQPFERANPIIEKGVEDGYWEAGVWLVHEGVVVWNDRQDFMTATRYYETAIELFERTIGPEHLRVYWALGFLCGAYWDTGRTGESKECSDRRFDLLETLRKRESTPKLEADSLDTEAGRFEAAGEIARARELFRAALAIREEIYGPFNNVVGWTRFQVARTSQRLGDYDEARRMYEMAQRSWEGAGLWGDPPFEPILLGVSWIHEDLGEFGEARRLRRTALETQPTLHDEVPHPGVGPRLVDYSQFLMRAGRPEDALDAALKAERIIRPHVRLTLTGLSEREGLRYAATWANGLDVLLSVAAESGSRETVEAAFDGVVRARALVLDEIATRQNLAWGSNDPEVRRLTDQLVSVRGRLADLMVRSSQTSEIEDHQALIEQTASEKEALERRLAERSVTFRRALNGHQADARAIRAALGPDEAMVSYVRYRRIDSKSDHAGEPATLDSPDQYFAFVVTRDRIAGRSLGPAEPIDVAVTGFRRWMVESAVAGVRMRGGATASTSSGVELRRLVWDPIERHLDGSARVFIVPDGDVNLVQLDALSSTGDSYLIETGPKIHYLAAERDVVVAGGPADGSGLLALGAPAFDEPRLYAQLRDEPRVEVENVPIVMASGQRFRGSRSSCGTFKTIRFEALPASRQETSEIAFLWDEAGAEGQGREVETDEGQHVLVGSAANETSFKALATGRRVLHVATHGFFLGNACPSAADGAKEVGLDGLPPDVAGENPLLLSGLALAGANYRDAAGPNEDDGILTAEEIASLDLSSVEWAVLSACDTGIGEVRAGEGVFGLRRAFQIAGAQTLIMSLWPVDDEVTRAWMRELYTNRFVKDMSTIDSVHEASLALLNERREKGLSTHPFYWAGFIASGDWR